MQFDTLNDKKCPTKEYTEPASSSMKAGVFTDELNMILQNATGEYSESGGSLAPMSIYSIFQTTISDIFPRTLSFTDLQSTDDNIKVTLSTPKTEKGVEITKWKELTFFLPSELKRLSTKDFSPFTLHFLGNRVDYGELPHIIFHPRYSNLLLLLCLK